MLMMMMMMMMIRKRLPKEIFKRNLSQTLSGKGAGIISLFGGVSSVLPAIRGVLGIQPAIFVGAECNKIRRHLVAERHGLRLDGRMEKTLWRNRRCLA